MDELLKRTEPIDRGTWLMEPKRIELSKDEHFYRWAEVKSVDMLVLKHYRDVHIPVIERVVKIHLLQKEKLVTDRAGMFAARQRWQMRVIFKHPDVEQAWQQMEEDLRAAQEARNKLRRSLIEAGFWKRLRYLFTRVLA